MRSSRIPDALAGAYCRNGPNLQFDPQGMNVGFLGEGMIHAFFLELSVIIPPSLPNFLPFPP